LRDVTSLSDVSYNFQNHLHTFCPLRHGIKAITIFTNPLTETVLQHCQIFTFILPSSDVFSIVLKAKHINVATCTEKWPWEKAKNISLLCATIWPQWPVWKQSTSKQPNLNTVTSKCTFIIPHITSLHLSGYLSGRLLHTKSGLLSMQVKAGQYTAE